MTAVAPTLQAFFTDRLVQQRQASPRTIAAYRDALRLLLAFVHRQTSKLPSQLDWDDLDATVITAFLGHLETERGNNTRTRNVRLTRSGRCSATPRCATPSTRWSSPGSWRSPRNGSTSAS